MDRNKITLDAYLFFDGNCREAMEFYQGIFGGKLDLNTYAESPDNPDTAGMKDKIMHAALMGGVINLMASDTPYPDKLSSAKVHLSLSGWDEAKLRELFEKLSDGGKVNMPLEKQFWGDTYGMLTDKYGFDWMVNIGDPEKLA